MDKRIVITGREAKTPFIFDERTYTVIPVNNPKAAEGMRPVPFLAYFINPGEKPNEDSSWDYWSLMYKVCGSNINSLCIVRPGFLESLSCSEVDKLRGFISEEQ